MYGNKGDHAREYFCGIFCKIYCVYSTPKYIGYILKSGYEILSL